MMMIRCLHEQAGLTATGAFAVVAEIVALTPKQVKTVISSYFELAASDFQSYFDVDLR